MTAENTNRHDDDHDQYSLVPENTNRHQKRYFGCNSQTAAFEQNRTTGMQINDQNSHSRGNNTPKPGVKNFLGLIEDKSAKQYADSYDMHYTKQHHHQPTMRKIPWGRREQQRKYRTAV